MSTKDFETALVDMVVAYLRSQETKKQQEILSKIISNVTGRKKKSAGGGSGSATDSETEDKPAKAKRAPSAYNIWMQEIRSSVVDKNPGLTPQEVVAEIGRLWNIKRDNPEMSNDEVIAAGYPIEAAAATAPVATPPESSSKRVIQRKK